MIFLILVNSFMLSFVVCLSERRLEESGRIILVPSFISWTDCDLLLPKTCFAAFLIGDSSTDWKKVGILTLCCLIAFERFQFAILKDSASLCSFLMSYVLPNLIWYLWGNSGASFISPGSISYYFKSWLIMSPPACSTVLSSWLLLVLEGLWPTVVLFCPLGLGGFMPFIARELGFGALNLVFWSTMTLA